MKERATYRSLKHPSKMLTVTAIKKTGGSVTELAKVLGLSPQAIYKWGDRVPMKRVKQLEAYWAAQKAGGV